MNVFVLNDYAYENGGASAVAFWIVKKLATESSMNLFFYAGTGEFAQEICSLPRVKTYSLNQFDILADPNRFRAMCRGLWNYEAATRLESILGEYDPVNTVIHVHSYQKILTSACIYVAKKRGFPVVMHLHDYGMICPNLAFYDFQKNEICQRRSLSLDCFLTNCDSRKYIHKLWRFARSCVEKLYAGFPYNVDAYIAVSEFSAALFEPYVSKGGRCYVLPTPSFFELNDEFHPEGNRYLVFVGRLSPEKNPMLLAKCAYELHIPVIFIGDGICRESILKINPNAIITGWVSKGDVFEYLKRARCAVFPTLLYETQGLAVEEALSCGIPVIVSDVCAAREVVQHEKNGLLFHSNSETSLKNCILSMSNDDIVKTMSLRARHLYKQRRERSERYIESLLDIYKNTIEGVIG